MPTGIDWPELVFFSEDFSNIVLGTFVLSCLCSPTILEMSKGLLAILCLLSCPPSHCILAGADEGPLKSSTAGVFTDIGESNGEESAAVFSLRALLCLQRRTVE